MGAGARCGEASDGGRCPSREKWVPFGEENPVWGLCPGSARGMRCVPKSILREQRGGFGDFPGRRRARLAAKKFFADLGVHWDSIFRVNELGRIWRGDCSCIFGRLGRIY